MPGFMNGGGAWQQRRQRLRHHQLLLLLSGYSHSDSYRLFRLGEVASAGVKEFAETADTAELDKEKREREEVIDGFAAPPIEKGSGKSEASLFVDGNHTLVREEG